MSHKDNMDLRPRGDGGWAWFEQELFETFTPLIGPQGIAVYMTMARLIPLVAADPWRYDFGVRRISAWSGMSKSTAAKFLRLICNLGMVVETRYTDGRENSYKLASLRELAKLGEAELRERAGVRVADTLPYDFRTRNREQRERSQQKALESVQHVERGPLFQNDGGDESVVRHTDTPSGAALTPAEVSEPAEGVRVADTVSAQDAEVSAVGPKVSAQEDQSAHHADTYREEKRKLKASTTPLPPAERGEVEGSSLPEDDTEQAAPGLDAPDAEFGDADFAAQLPAAAEWALAQLGITKRRLLPVVQDQLRLYCRGHVGTTIAAAAQRMVQQGRQLHVDAALLRHRPWGWQRFLGEGHWARPLPYATASPDEQRLAQRAAVGSDPRSPEQRERDNAEAAAHWTKSTIDWLYSRCHALVRWSALRPFTAELEELARRFAAGELEVGPLSTELDAMEPRLAVAFARMLDRAESDDLELHLERTGKLLRSRGVSKEAVKQQQSTAMVQHLAKRHGMPRLPLAHMEFNH